MDNSIIERTIEIKQKSIENLIQNETLALIVENFYAADLCDSLYIKLQKDKNSEIYTHETIEDNKLVLQNYGVNRIGLPFNSTYNTSDAELINAYYREAQVARERLRQHCYPAFTPIDKLRLILDEVFIPGASVAHFQNKKMLTGIARISSESLSYLSEIQPHFDALPLKYAEFDKQLAANIYLNTPEDGGELELWNSLDLTPLTQVPKNWREKLPPSIKIKPKKGDLIIFNCRKPHAICAFKGKERITIQVFIGYKEGMPLMLWN
ncbi:2OG-Fe(II) oxygenase [Fluviispira vulneris]|uniref:2OG-Fe(II) oxygenase n=1 Tax=Fluviispira vulneris TaxID=2763012 RepID=UPI00164643ED|nr:2OG-Fe(II) oxygenase [Fluviispira vulneris]